MHGYKSYKYLKVHLRMRRRFKYKESSIKFDILIVLRNLHSLSKFSVLFFSYLKYIFILKDNNLSIQIYKNFIYQNVPIQGILLFTFNQRKDKEKPVTNKKKTH
jgi:hypothetical protein